MIPAVEDLGVERVAGRIVFIAGRIEFAERANALAAATGRRLGRRLVLGFGVFVKRSCVNRRLIRRFFARRSSSSADASSTISSANDTGLPSTSSAGLLAGRRNFGDAERCLTRWPSPGRSSPSSSSSDISSSSGLSSELSAGVSSFSASGSDAFSTSGNCGESGLSIGRSVSSVADSAVCRSRTHRTRRQYCERSLSAKIAATAVPCGRLGTVKSRLRSGLSRSTSVSVACKFRCVTRREPPLLGGGLSSENGFPEPGPWQPAAVESSSKIG